AAAVAAEVDDLERLSGKERERALLHLVRARVADVLGHASVDAIEPDRAFSELGFDSLTAVELRNRLSAEVGTTLPATLVFDHPTARAVAAFRNGTQRTSRDGGRAGGADVSDEPIAIVGIACRFPGGVRSPEDLWRV